MKTKVINNYEDTEYFVFGNFFGITVGNNEELLSGVIPPPSAYPRDEDTNSPRDHIKMQGEELSSPGSSTGNTEYVNYYLKKNDSHDNHI